MACRVVTESWAAVSPCWGPAGTNLDLQDSSVSVFQFKKKLSMNLF